VTCPFEVNDGAYILGALGPAERAEFEQHLATCPACRESVTQLAVLPGLLGRLHPDTVLPQVAAPPDVLPRVLGVIRARRRAQRRALSVAAACVAVATTAAAVAVGVQLYDRPPPVTTVAPTENVVAYLEMLPSGDEELSAQIAITDVEFGTLVTVRCRYLGSSDESWPIWMVVYPRDENERAEPIGSWVASSGEQIDVTAVTFFAPDEIERIELQGYGNTTLASWTP
jgi:hypothetical protein